MSCTPCSTQNCCDDFTLHVGSSIPGTQGEQGPSGNPGWKKLSHTKGDCTNEITTTSATILTYSVPTAYFTEAGDQLRIQTILSDDDVHYRTRGTLQMQLSGEIIRFGSDYLGVNFTGAPYYTTDTLITRISASSLTIDHKIFINQLLAKRYLVSNKSQNSSPIGIPIITTTTPLVITLVGEITSVPSNYTSTLDSNTITLDWFSVEHKKKS